MRNKHKHFVGLLVLVCVPVFGASLVNPPLTSPGNSQTLTLGQSNQVVNIVNTVAPTNSGIQAPQGTNISVFVAGNNSIANTNGSGTGTSLTNFVFLDAGNGWSIFNNSGNGTLMVSNKFWNANWLTLKTNGATVGLPPLSSAFTVSGGETVNGELASTSARILGGLTNSTLSASSDVGSDANKKLISQSNAFGTKTNDGSGNVGYALVLPVGTQIIYATNSLAAPVVDFSVPVSSTNMSGTLTFTGIANAQSGIRNSCVITLYPNGSDRPFVIPVGWHTNAAMTSVVSNSFDHTDLLFTCIPGKSTNCAQLDYRQ